MRTSYDGFSGPTTEPVVGDVLAPFEYHGSGHKTVAVPYESVVVAVHDVPSSGGLDSYPGYREFRVVPVNSPNTHHVDAVIGCSAIHGIAHVLVLRQASIAVVVSDQLDVRR